MTGVTKGCGKVTETSSRSESLAGPAPAEVDGHLDTLDGVRAIAAFAVLVFHVASESGAALRDGFGGALLSRGDVAVPIFFALSGLLLYRPFAAALLRGDSPSASGSTCGSGRCASSPPTGWWSWWPC